jgi:ubiquinone/menaquinone biosynthesis C-methylase UbiE
MYNLQTHMTVNNYYDRIADIYDRSRWLTDSVAEEVADFILALVNATPETKFLEPGAGSGLNVLPLVGRGYSVTGIDISREMLDRLRQKLPEIPPNLTLVHADASQLPFPDRSFDVVLAVHMVHTVSNWMIFIDEITRVLKQFANFRLSWLIL